MDGAAVVDTLRNLADLLERQLPGAQAAPALIGRIDGAGLLDYASRRTDATEESLRLKRTLDGQLEELRRTNLIASATVAALASAHPTWRTSLEEQLGRVRRAAQALSQLDSRCRASASRALGIVRAYASVLRPVSRAYDYRGSAANFEPVVTHSQRA